VESTQLNWRTLAKRQWPLTLALVGILALEITTFEELRQFWQVPGVLVVAALAVVSPRRPYDAALAATAAVLASAVMLHFLDVVTYPQMFYSGVTPSQTAAIMALIAILVRQAPASHAVIGTVLLIAAVVSAEVLGTNYYTARFPDGGFTPERFSYVVGGAVFLVISLLTGLYFRARDRERVAAVENEVTAAQHAERMALARELHDVVAHYVTAIVVHSQAGQVNPAMAQQVLPVITQSGNEALTAMRRLVGTLRGAEPTSAPSSDLADDVRKLAEESGQPVRLSFELDEQVPPELGRSVMRLVQESLTNSRKHASGVSAVDVSLSTNDGHVHVLVQDNGNSSSSAPVGGSGGYGLVGMRERVELLGGSFHAGRREPRGWTVRASLPIA
jgi:signal transduction histidine kinase